MSSIEKASIRNNIRLTCNNRVFIPQKRVKDSSLKSLVVFIIAKRRVKSDTGRGGVVGECDIPFAAVTAVQTMLSGFAVS